MSEALFRGTELSLQNWLATFWQTWLGRASGPRAIEATRAKRLASLVGFARAHSPLYGDLYCRVPDGPVELATLPVAIKTALMERYDDWVTDRRITRARVDAFLADRTRIGERFDDRYVIWKSSGTTGHEGIFVQDDEALGIYDALLAVQLATPDLAARIVAGSTFRGGRAALIAATGDHFASITSWQRVCRSAPGMDARGFSVMEPLDQLVEKLNAFQPAYLASYPTMLALLAEEKRAHRLRIQPFLMWSGGEYLGERTLDDLENTFGCRVMNEYGASECLSIAFGCAQHWLHVNADWVIVEPVDSDYGPTPLGKTSRTVLITNLANRVQPIIRYDLGDAVVANPERCACGNPLPAIRVEGRRDDILCLQHGDQKVRIAPLALTTVLEDATGLHRFQIAQIGTNRLMIRLSESGHAERYGAFRAGMKALRRYLASQGIAGTVILLDEQPPRPDRRSGKLRQVISEVAQPARAKPLSEGTGTSHGVSELRRHAAGGRTRHQKAK